EAPVLFLEPGLEAHVHGLDLQLIDALRARWNQRLPTLVVLPKWELSYGFGQTVRHREFPVELGRLYSPTGFEIAVGSQDQSTTSDGLALHVPELQLIANPPANAEVLYDTSEGALLIRIGRTLILSDPDLL